jgi:tRNA pseudouridine13 synthase
VRRPGDWKGALGLLDPRLRSLWLAAFQSHLFNRVLSQALRETVAPERLFEVALKAGTVVFPRELSDGERARLDALVLPLPSSRVRLEDGFAKDVTERTLASLALTLRDVDVKAPRGSFFSKGERRAFFRLEAPEHDGGADEVHPGRRKVSLWFGLPRGSYATILVKRLTRAPEGG